MDNERTLEARNDIIIEDLAKSFGDVKAVNGLTLNIKKGEMFGFLGPNGANPNMDKGGLPIAHFSS